MVELELRLLGPLEVWRGQERVALPRSKKARALLAYLAMTGREHNRQRLCSLLWDVTDDPRGALRWSLSKLRRVVDEPGVRRIVADRQSVRLDGAGARVDVHELLEATKRGSEELALERLEQLASPSQGEFLEGFELPDFLEFQAWLIGCREQARVARCEVLAELVARLGGEPARALPYAHARVQADPLDVPARVGLLQMLLRSGLRDEASQQLDVACRMLRETGAPGVAELQGAWRRMLSAPLEHVPEPVAAPSAAVVRAEPGPVVGAQPFVGRAAERSVLFALLDQCRASGTQQVALVSGDPGAGKSRLAGELVAQARALNMAVLGGRAYEAESSRPYGPWVDAFGGELAALHTENAGDPAPLGRDALFGAASEALERRAAVGGGALLVLDDIQWLDRDSTELLHFVARTTQDQPIFVLLLARSGELSDNEAAMRALRSLRREAPLAELDLGPLSPTEVAELVGEQGVDASLFEASAGNPLYALELARARAAGIEQTPASLMQLVRERIERLPARAAELLRWGAVLGHTLEVSRLAALSSSQPAELMDALERLERHALLRGDEQQPGGRYVFAHDVVRASVYSDLSQPRRRLMHQQVARILQPRASEPAVATEMAHHASLAGDAKLGVQACVVAARRSLRLCANADAEALARRGLSLVDQLQETERVGGTLELLQVQYAARTPDRQEAAIRVQGLAEHALDLGLNHTARLGFQMLSYLRWESSRMMDAHDNIMQAERISRSADPAERSVALAQAAKCLVLLERDMGQAEAFALEARSLSEREGAMSSAVAFATGMLHEHRGEAQQARHRFEQARALGREAGDRLAEFCAIEHWTMLELDQGQEQAALELAQQLEELGQRVRSGAEGPSARALLVLARCYSGHAEVEPDLEAALEGAIEQLVLEDAKYELAFVLTRLAALELRRGSHEGARAHAERALEIATALGRKSELALAHVVLVRCAQVRGDDWQQHRGSMEGLSAEDLSSGARKALEEILGGT